ncbi:DUF2768 family protein [Paenibacillus koleovorans]|uniref:DUF2768 family protein n=1 Tax=Paenibacillus koleovorans TaxID=121608 RepID=UPI000FD71459|nr:DUF2768 family protein [Paenibacillus koleovorans]
MSSLDKMWASFVGMGLMIVASLLITFARVKLGGFFRVVVSIIAFLLLLISIVFMLASLL